MKIPTALKWSTEERMEESETVDHLQGGNNTIENRSGTGVRNRDKRKHTAKKSGVSKFYQEAGDLGDVFIVERTHKEQLGGGEPVAGPSGYQTHPSADGSQWTHSIDLPESKPKYIGQREPGQYFFKYDTSTSSDTSESEPMDDVEDERKRKEGKTGNEVKVEQKKENQKNKKEYAGDGSKRRRDMNAQAWDDTAGIPHVTWKSWDLAEKHEGNHHVFVSLALRDFILYMVFLAAVTTVALGSLNFTMYLYSFILSDVLTKSYFEAENNIQTNFRQLRTIDQLWTYIFKVYLETIVCKRSIVHGKKIQLATSGDLLLVFENLIIGVPRIRQLRVRPDSCKIPEVFEEIFDRCYGYFSSQSESKKPFGEKDGSEWTYTDGLASTYTGRVSHYLEGGFYFNFSRDCYKTRQTLLSMKDKGWIDPATRAVFLDFSVYSPNVNLFCTSKLVAELPPSGGVITRSHFKTLKLIRYVTIWEHVILGVELFSVLFLIYYTLQEIRKMAFFKWFYLFQFWNIIDLSIILLGWTAVGYSLVRYLVVSVELPMVVETMESDGHGNLDSLGQVQETFDILVGFLVAVMWIKLLKYLMLSRTIYHVLSTIRKVFTELLGLTLILFVLLLSFALFGHLLYGSQVEEFGSLTSSIISLALLIIGALDYEKILNIRPIIGAIFFILFIFLYVLVFLSLLIAILVNGFTAMRYEIIEDENRVFMKDIIYKCLYYTLKCLRLNPAAERVNTKLVEDKIKQDYQGLLEILRRSGFRGREMYLFLDKHGVREGEPISDETLQKIYKEIDAKGQLYMEAIEHEQIMSQVDVLKIRMNYVDKMTEEMAAKVELLLDKIINKEQKG